MKITKVLGSRVLVQVIEEQASAETESGLAIAPTSINPSFFKGEVIGIGPMVTAFVVDTVTEETKTGVVIGDKVAFVKYGYEDMGDGQYLVEENSLLAVYE